MFIDPVVEPFMAEAPLGSCINDPVQATWPKARAIVYAPEFHNIPESQPMPPPVARAAAYNCGVKVNPTSPYVAAGYEQQDSQGFCFEPVTETNVYLALKRYNYGWQTHEQPVDLSAEPEPGRDA